MLSNVLFSAILGLLSTASPAAQETAKEKGLNRPQTVTIDFPGGTIGAYLDELRKIGINTVAGTGVKDIPLPPVSVRGASSVSAIKLIESAVEQSHRFKVTCEFMPESPSTEPIYVVRVTGTPGNADYDIGQTSTVIFSLKKLIEMDGGPKLKPETVLTAIETATNLEGAKNAAKMTMKFHSDSGLLIVRATNSQLIVVDSLLRKLEEGQQVTNYSELHKEISSLRNEISGLKKTLQDLQATKKD